MNPQDVEFIFQSYITFEKKLIDIFRVVPFSKENEAAWSPELVNLFLDASSLIDSVSRSVLGGSDKLKIDDFEKKLFGGLELLQSRVVVYIYPLQLITPYQNYRDPNGWWTIYNSLKHNRIQNYNKANMGNTLKALAALFLLLVRNKEEEYSKALFRFDWIDTGIVPEFFHEERSGEPWSIWYDSELFGTHEIAKNIPEDLDKINPALTSQKFRKYFGRFNP